MTRSYLDHNATVPLRPEAHEAMLGAMALGGNPSSIHAEGRAARIIVENARQDIAAAFGASPASVYFTSGATEAANWLLRPSGQITRLIAGATEHACILHGGDFSKAQIEIAAVDEAGRHNPASLQKSLSLCSLEREQGGALLAVQAANNETGVIQPVTEIARIATEANAVFICDAVQAIGRMDLNAFARAISAGAVFFSAHKFGGSKGAGAVIFGDSGFYPEPLLRGGGQEKRRRSGTENVTGIAGMAAALTAALRDFPAFSQRAEAWQAQIEAGIKTIAPAAVIFGEGAPRLPNTTCFAAPGISAELALIALDLDGVAVSSGSACSSGKVERSHVLDAIGVNPTLGSGAIRVSTGWNTQDADIEKFLSAFAKICNKRRLLHAA